MAEPMLRVVLCWSLGPRHVHEMALQVPVGSAVQDVLEMGVAQCLSDQASSDSAALSSLQFQQPGIWAKKVLWTQVV